MQTVLSITIDGLLARLLPALIVAAVLLAHPRMDSRGTVAVTLWAAVGCLSMDALVSTASLHLAGLPLAVAGSAAVVCEGVAWLCLISAAVRVRRSPVDGEH